MSVEQVRQAVRAGRAARRRAGGRGDALGRARLGLPARRRRRAVRRGRRARAARQLRVARRLPTPTSATAASCAHGSASSLSVTRVQAPAPGAAGNLQAWARDVRYDGGPRAGRGPTAPWSRPGTRPATRSRRSSTAWRHRRTPRAARHGRGGRSPDATAAGRDARADGGLLSRARPGLARGREQRGRALRSRARAQRGWCRRCARCTRRPSPTCCARRRCCARRPSCSTRSSTPSWTDARADRDRAAARAARRRSRAWSSCAWPSRPAERYVPQAGERVGELLALAERGGRAELHVGGQAASGDRGRRAAHAPLPARHGREPDAVP